jgi:hypothetical protein
MVVREPAWPAAIWTSRRSTQASSRVHAGDSNSVGGGQVVESAGGGVTVHAGAAGVEQERPGGAVAGGAVDGVGDRRWERYEDDLGAFAVGLQDAVAVLLAEVGDVGAGGFEDPQPEQAEHDHRGEVGGVCRVAGGCEHGFELQVRQSQGGGLGWDVGSADVLGRGVFHHGVDDAGAVEPGHHRHPPGDRGGFVVADLLHPPHVQLDVDPAGGQRRRAPFGAPGQEDPQVGFGVATWPRTTALYCHPLPAADWPEQPEIVERVPVRSCARRGAAVDLVLDRVRESRSQIVFTTARGRDAVFWQSPRTRKQARPGYRWSTRVRRRDVGWWHAGSGCWGWLRGGRSDGAGA